MDLVARYGPQNWNFIADKLNGRSGDGFHQSQQDRNILCCQSC